MHRMKDMMERLEGYAAQELNKSVEQIDAKELGCVVDCIKDLCEGMYYYSVVKAMEERKEEDKLMDKMGRRYYEGQPRNEDGEFMSPRNRGGRRGYGEYYPPEIYNPWYYNYQRDMDRDYGRMYYGGGSNQGNPSGGQGGNSSSRAYSDGQEGRSGYSRREYMEMKHDPDKQKKMNQLEVYMQELSSDITEMIGDASPEEKAALKQKLLNLHQKI